MLGRVRVLVLGLLLSPACMLLTPLDEASESSFESGQESTGGTSSPPSLCGDGECFVESCRTCPLDCGSCPNESGGSGESGGGFGATGGASTGGTTPVGEAGGMGESTALEALPLAYATAVTEAVMRRFIPLEEGAYESDSCRDCVATRCGHYLKHCTPGTSCGEVIACFDACSPSDASCLAECAGSEAHQVGVALLAASLDCVTASCTAVTEPLRLVEMPGDGRLGTFEERVLEGAAECLSSPLSDEAEGYAPFCTEVLVTAGIVGCGTLCVSSSCPKECQMFASNSLLPLPEACALEAEPACSKAGDFCLRHDDCCDERCSYGFCLKPETKAWDLGRDFLPAVTESVPYFEQPSVPRGGLGEPCYYPDDPSFKTPHYCDEGLVCGWELVCHPPLVGEHPYWNNNSFKGADYCPGVCSTCDRTACLEYLPEGERERILSVRELVCDPSVDCLATCAELSLGTPAYVDLVRLSDFCSCTPSCEGRVCGDDYCPAQVEDYCGACDAGSMCNGQHCVPECEPGACGGDCGLCTSQIEYCNEERRCAPIDERPPDCTPQCDGRSCGYDGCGGSCGSCETNETCNPFGQCIQACAPVCENRECGTDGCFGSCGTCGGSTTCREDTQHCCATTGCGPGCPCGEPLECFNLFGTNVCSADQSNDNVNVQVPAPPAPAPDRPTASAGGTPTALGCNVVDCAKVTAVLEEGFSCDQDVDARFTNNCGFTVRCYYHFEYAGKATGFPLYDIVPPGTKNEDSVDGDDTCYGAGRASGRYTSLCTDAVEGDGACVALFAE